MEKPLDYIYIDTSIFRSKSYFKQSEAVYRLFELAEEGWIIILMPEIAKREWFKHFKETTTLRFEEVERKATLMGNTKDANEFTSKHKELVESYDDLVKSTFEYHIDRAHVNVLTTSYICDTLPGVIDKYFNVEKPFGPKKLKEFPDAFILASLEKYANDNEIKNIYVFSTDKDMYLSNEELFINTDIDKYLHELISNRIPEHVEAEKRKRYKRNVSMFCNFLESDIRFEIFHKQIGEAVEELLSNPTSYYGRYNGADVDWAYVDKMEMSRSDKDIEIISIKEYKISGLYYMDVNAEVTVSVFSEEDSIWDAEEKDFFYRKYDEVQIDLSSQIKITFEMTLPNSDNDDFDLMMNISKIDTDDLQDVIDDYNH